MTFRRIAIAALAFAAFVAHAQVSPFVVTSTSDAATTGTLRFALQQAGLSCSPSPPPAPILITFAIPAGPFKIQPATPLPAINCSTTIDGYSQPGSSPNTNTGDGTNATILIEIDGSLCGTACTSGLRVINAPGAFFQGLSIHSFQGPAITGSVTSSLDVQGNFIGVDPSGNGLGNAGPGVDFAGGGGFLTVGGSPSGCLGNNPGLPLPAGGCRNLIGANTGPGINIQSGATGVSITNNLIGGTRNGTAGNGNGGAGIQSAGGASISANFIRYNTGPGIAITSTFIHNILGNWSIYGNGGLGIDYGTLGSPFPPPVTFFTYDPTLNVTTVKATVSGEPPTTLGPSFIDLYSNPSLPPFGEGQSLLISTQVTVDGAGNGAVGPFTFPGRIASVTGTFMPCGDGCSSTSQFSNPDAPPDLGIQFPTNPIAMGTTGSIVLQLMNPNKTRTLSAVGYTFTLPSGLTMGTMTAGTDCAAGLVFSNTATSVSVSGVTLTPNPSSNMSCTLGATLTPTAGGVYNFAAGTAIVASDAGQGTNSAASLTVTTVAGITATPNPLNFGTVQLGNASSLAVTVQSNGTAPLDVTGATVTGAGYAVTGNTCTTGMVAPASCAITVTFTPTVLGAANGQLAITSSAATSPTNVLLTGAGGAPGLQFTPASLAFGRQDVGTTSAAQAVALQNTGSTTLSISSIVASGDFGYTGCGFPLTLAPGASCTMSVTFTPSVTGISTGSISVTSNAASSPNVLPLTGTGVNGPTPGIFAQPTRVGFGTIAVGTRKTSRVIVSNTGTAPLAIAGITTSGTFFSQANNCPASLPVGGNCDVDVTYSPTSVGAQSGQLIIQSNASPGTLSVALDGTALAQLPASLSVDPGVDFGPQAIGTTAHLPLDLRNTGQQALNVTAIDVQGSTAFDVSGTCASIAPGATCTLTLIFTPTALGSFTGTLRITSNDARGTVPVALSGQGIAAPRPEIAITPDGVGFPNQLITTQGAGQTISIRSVGGAPLHIRGLSVTGPFLLAGACPSTLAVGAQCDVTVGFLPIAPGPNNGRLTVDSDAEAGRGFVSLTGTGCRFFSVTANRILVKPCAP